MSCPIRVPSVGESITEVIVSKWLKSPGDAVKKDEALVTLETDKVNVDVVAEADGTLARIMKKAQDTAQVGEVIGEIEAGAGAAGAGASAGSVTPQGAKDSAPPQAAATADTTRGAPSPSSSPVPSPAPAAASRATSPAAPGLSQAPAHHIPATGGEARVMPAAGRAMAEHHVSASQVEATGPGGRILKEDVMRAAHAAAAGPAPAAQPQAAAPVAKGQPAAAGAQQRVVPMSPMRRRIAERLVQVQHTAAILTTFNEVDMSQVMQMRRVHQDAFTKAHGIKLGFMSFFVKAAVDALRAYPEVNAEIRGTDIVYHDSFDIGVAVGSEKGLVVPVVRRAELLGFAELERTIADFGKRAQTGKIALTEMQGGTFTITNGGVYGSLMSTPILNPPQSGILGMHNIVERPIGVDGQVVLRPMMYIALSYDHRMVDGRQAVSFLRRIKQCIEEPARMLVEV